MFRNLKLAAKLGIGFGTCLLLAILVGLFAIKSMDNMRQASEKMQKDAGLSSVAANLDIDLVQSIRAVKNLLLSDTDEDNKKFASQAEQYATAFDSDLAEFGKSVYTDAGKKAYADTSKAWADYMPYHKKIIELGLQNDNKKGQKVSLQARPVVAQIEKAIGDFREMKRKNMAYMEREVAATASSARSLTITLLLSAVFIGIVVSVLLTKGITSTVALIGGRFLSIRQNDVDQLTNGLLGLAKGNLTIPALPSTQPIALGTHDEFGQMANTFDEMLADLHGAVNSYNEARESLTEMVRDLSRNSASVASTSQALAAASEESGAAASQIAAGSEKLARGATDSASVVEELVAQIDLVRDSSQGQLSLVTSTSETLKSTASGIGEVATFANQMTDAAKKGNRAVGETIEAMARVQETVAVSAVKVKDLDHKGQEIGAIVSTIEQIADQTNLLALNAAIEAARAGEHGRGFAVVAEEVRKLAEGASFATRQISELIGSVRSTVEDTVKAIEKTTVEATAGTETSENAGKALVEILSSAEQVATQSRGMATLTQEAADSMQTIAVSAKENANSCVEVSSGAERVGSSITEVAAVSEESAAGAQELSASVEEVSAAAGELARMSQELEEIVGRFEIERTQSHSRPLLRAA